MYSSIFPNAKLVLFLYSDNEDDLDINAIEQKGITVIKLTKITDKDIIYNEFLNSNSQYRASLFNHPYEC